MDEGRGKGAAVVSMGVAGTRSSAQARAKTSKTMCEGLLTTRIRVGIGGDSGMGVEVGRRVRWRQGGIPGAGGGGGGGGGGAWLPETAAV